MIKAARQGMSWLAVLLAAALAGCASPPSRFYTLTVGAAPDGGAPAAYAVAVDSVTIPAIVDRPQFVLQKGPNRVLLDEFNRWAAPLAANIASTLAANLGVLLGTPRAVFGPLAANIQPAYRVSVDVQRFESVADEAVTLEGVWLLRRPGGEATSGRSALRETVQGEGYEALAAAHSRALAGMSRDIAAAIRVEAGRSATR
ncbi:MULTISPECIES: PqiC family protein [Candidatus Accumulibacter]|uniref:ABC-type transport auxiliary lipoprotein component domain-containing protein n=1 Tax=Candidatus Accumulibacter phosphatis TaxID=327160 RepID=A0A5S4EJG8_9PROT|nr:MULTISPECIES: PqiC family protein [Candidatus Accumulibacter]MCC2867308.1 PqiC family protein [Candidatus Accumulibacter phosphatis]MCM8581012.1 PqiC family protein [Accumulibacter sp.]TMQ75497.1 hypothetical protein ACCUM_1241 [Candidatus Accumulibacter phosphatis]HMW54425.1 PqiC family protein [Accumulibacter sp.]